MFQVPGVVTLVAALDPSGDLWIPLFGQGIAGCVLAWFMLRNEVRMRALEVATDDNTKATMLLCVRLDPENKTLADQSARMLARIEAKGGK